MPPDVPATVKSNVPLEVMGDPETDTNPPVNDALTEVTLPPPPPPPPPVALIV